MSRAKKSPEDATCKLTLQGNRNGAGVSFVDLLTKYNKYVFLSSVKFKNNPKAVYSMVL